MTARAAKAAKAATAATAATAGPARLSARDRLLAAANELFYREGVHTVGIDRIILHAGVAKASLYNSFSGKDDLVDAYLRSRHASISDRVSRAVSRYQTPRDQLLAVFEAQHELLTAPDFHGCAFANATAETSGDRASQSAAEYRQWLRGLFTDLARQAGAPAPEALARQLHRLWDGASLSGRMDRDGQAATAARSAAAVLLDAALAETAGR
jgi:AcrR family transcriptional regulator